MGDAKENISSQFQTYGNLIGGKFSAPDSTQYFKDLNPADQSDVIGLFPESGQSEIDAAVRAARDAFPAWSRMTAPQRGELIYRAAEILSREKDILAKVIVREMGKNLPASKGDIQSSVDVAYFMAGEGRRLYGRTTHSSNNNRWALTRRVPVGVCGLITAWNAPMAIITWKLFPALICGNTVVLKPSEDTPLTAYLLGEILAEVGIPPGVVNIVYGAGAETGRALVEHPQVDLISFTGSTLVGRKIARACGDQLKKCSLELGGKNGLIVMDDADLEGAVTAVVAGAFSCAGQRCASTSRVFVHEKIYDRFLEMLLSATEEIKVGFGEDPEAVVCPIINKRQFESILTFIEKAKRDGARLVCGGQALTAGDFAKGHFIAPTIFTNVDPKSALAQEEIFGPVLAVFKIGSLREAIELVNSTSYGLTASIFTNNVNRGIHTLEELEAGCCYCNAATFGSEPHLPFGGFKQSGIGSREPGTEAMDVFSELKTIYIQYEREE